MNLIEIQGIEDAITGIETELREIEWEIQQGLIKAGNDLLVALRKYIPVLTENASRSIEVSLKGPGEVSVHMKDRGPYDPESTEYIFTSPVPHTTMDAHKKSACSSYLHGQTMKVNPNASADGVWKDSWVKFAMIDIGISNPERYGSLGDFTYGGTITGVFKDRYLDPYGKFSR